MSGGGGPSTITQNTTSQMLPQVQPYANQLMQGASNLATQPYPFPNQAVAPMNQTQQAGLYLTQQRALQGSPVQQSADQSLTNINNMNPANNPAYAPLAQEITQNYARGTAAQTDAAAARANALGSSGYNEQQQYNGLGLSQGLSQLAGGLYNTGVGQKLQAAALSPAAAGTDYQDLQNLLGTGDVQQQYQQSLINAGYTNAQAQAQYPYNMLNVLGGGIAGAFGNTGQYNMTGPNPYQANPAAQAIGYGSLGLGGVGLANQLGAFGAMGAGGAAGAGIGAGAAGGLGYAGLGAGTSGLGLSLGADAMGLYGAGGLGLGEGAAAAAPLVLM